MKLLEGVYENVISQELEDELSSIEQFGLESKRAVMDKGDSAKILADYLANAILQKLDDDSLSIAERTDIVNRIIEDAGLSDETKIADKEQLLTEVLSRTSSAQQTMSKTVTVRPASGFRYSTLFTGGGSALSMESEIQKDIASADEICLIVSFLKLSGINIFMNSLESFCKVEGHKLRIITTTYCGITEEKAIKQLSELPNTEIRISYDTKRERLHAKSYIFVRESGLNTAYIGSSNLSRSALTDGLEWNIRVTSVENPHIINTARGTFERYWTSPNFEDFSIGGIEKFRKEMKREKGGPDNPNTPTIFQRFSILPHQNAILSKLKLEREQNDNWRNLVVAATGTGKTVVSAFDYLSYRDKHRNQSRLLFVAHREEILKQSRLTFASVLRDANFGDIWTGNYKPQGDLDHLFVSVQTLNSQFDVIQKLGADYFDYIIVDEAHHSKADSYRKLFDFFRPKVLVGLTATPERMDGKSLLPDFNNKISAEIRLPQALEAGLLCPFHYFCITDNTDLSGDDLWGNGKYIVEKLSRQLCTKERAFGVAEAIDKYIADEHSCKALCFCADKNHANFMASFLRECNLNARALTDETNSHDRIEYNRQLREGTIQFLCVVDIFNEGVDLPEVDTVLFLRPTESLTIFLQQLGRGLRLSPGKEQLTVLDFVAQANRSYNFADRFRALCKRPDTNVGDEIEKGFSSLPVGCTITMEEKAQRIILENIHGTIYNITRLERELRSFSVTPSLSQFLQANGQDIRLVYRGKGCWSSLKRRAGKCLYPDTPQNKLYESGMGNLIHVNSLQYLRFLRDFAKGSNDYLKDDEYNHTYALMLYYAIYQKVLSKSGYDSIQAALYAFRSNDIFVSELREICDYLSDHLVIETKRCSDDLPATLELYGCYTREEAFTIFKRQTEEKQMHGSVSGVFKLNELNTELFFVTLNKSEKDFSPTTQYKDYLINEWQFHWQSQNTDSHARSGKRFVEQAANDKRFLLFVRENKNDGYGNTCPFYCFGLVDYVSSYGDLPMSITWQLEEPAMPQFVKAI